MRRVIASVEQLKQVGEPAFLASARFTPESGVTVRTHRAVAAVGADEVVLVRHIAPRIVSHLNQRMRACMPADLRRMASSGASSSCAAGGSRPKMLVNARRVAARPQRCPFDQPHAEAGRARRHPRPCPAPRRPTPPGSRVPPGRRRTSRRSRAGSLDPGDPGPTWSTSSRSSAASAICAVTMPEPRTSA